MSRVGLSPVVIPEGVNVTLNSGVVNVSSSKGEINVNIHELINVSIEDGKILFVPSNKKKETRQLWGTMRALVNNAVVGVVSGFKKQIEMNGVGYRASVSGNILKLSLGFSHDVDFEIPSSVNISVEGNVITVEGISKEIVGECASKIRSYRKPEPYKGKGLKYVGERIVRKEGKKK